MRAPAAYHAGAIPGSPVWVMDGLPVTRIGYLLQAQLVAASQHLGAAALDLAPGGGCSWNAPGTRDIVPGTDAAVENAHGRVDREDDLIRRASDPAASAESLWEAIGPVFATLSPGDRPSAEAVLRRLAEEVVDAPTRPDLAGTVAVFCGALVERSVGPTIAIGPILDCIEREIVPHAIACVAACEQAAQDDPSPTSIEGDGRGRAAERNDPPDPVERHGERIAALMPREAQSFEALGPLSMAAVAMLSRSIEARKASRSRRSLRAGLDELGGQYGHAGLIWVMMLVLDDEPIILRWRSWAPRLA